MCSGPNERAAVARMRTVHRLYTGKQVAPIVVFSCCGDHVSVIDRSLFVTHEVGVAAVRQILMHGTSSYHVLSTQAGPDWGGMEAGAGVYAVWGTLLSRVGG